APQLEYQSDVENLLFTNVDATGDSFRHLSDLGVAFEFRPLDPHKNATDPPLSHCSIYWMGPSGLASRIWRAEETLAQWERVPVPSFLRATSCGPVWWELRNNKAQKIFPMSACPRYFAVHLVAHVPAGMRVNSAARVKVAIDASVLSLCCDEGSPDAGIVAFASRIAQPDHEVR